MSDGLVVGLVLAAVLFAGVLLGAVFMGAWLTKPRRPQ